MLAGYFRGRLETFVVGGVDVLLAFPPLVLALAVTAYLGQTVAQHDLMIGVLGIPGLHPRGPGRDAHAIASANSSGGPRARRHRSRASWCASCCPTWRCRCWPSFCSGVAVTIVVEGALSFLGLGVPPPAAELGQHDRRGPREPGDRALARLPAGRRAMFLTVLAFNCGGRHAARYHRSAPGRL